MINVAPDYPMSQIESDIQKFSRDRLHAWTKDVVQACQIADVTPEVGTAIMVSELIGLATVLVRHAAPHMTPERLAKIMAEALTQARRNRK